MDDFEEPEPSRNTLGWMAPETSAATIWAEAGKLSELGE